MSAPLLDTYREVITPEGVALQLPAAGPTPRAIAWLIDLAARMALLSVLSIALGMLGKMGQGLYLIALFIVYWSYMILFEGFWKGQTLGKKAMKLRVVAANGAPVGWVAVLVRNLLRVVDMLPFGYAVGLVSSLCDPGGRRLGDLVAGTVVVHTGAAIAASDVPVYAPQALPAPLQPEEQIAVIEFGERAESLTMERQIELADIAEPLTGVRGMSGVRRLYAFANGLLGRT
ncbi:MAG: RDD family protein [Xanthomonadaceae bacterium]|jgi:uncharacterized RDD family membrane protein YckC|nr:RDD family protein [Xanthomonadaceae bacterium]